MKAQDYRSLLKNEWESRLAKNAAYSLRAFARDLKLTAPQLSEVFNGKRGLSRVKACQIADRLSWDTLTASRFSDLVEAEHGRSSASRKLAESRLKTYSTQEESLHLTHDSFKTVSEWYHFAILATFQIQNLAGNVPEIAKALQLAPLVVEEALKRMERLAIVERKNEEWILIKKAVFSPEGVGHEAVRNAHEQLLNLSIKALYLQTPEDRDFFSYILPIAGEDLPEIFKRCRKFTLKIREEFGNRPNANRVIHIGNHVFALSQNEKSTPEIESKKNTKIKRSSLQQREHL